MDFVKVVFSLKAVLIIFLYSSVNGHYICDPSSASLPLTFINNQSYLASHLGSRSQSIGINGVYRNIAG